jgi:hypothetical protein
MHLPQISPGQVRSQWNASLPLVNSGAIISGAKGLLATHHECSATHLVLETMKMRSAETMTCADPVVIALDMTEWMISIESSEDPESAGAC